MKGKFCKQTRDATSNSFALRKFVDTNRKDSLVPLIGTPDWPICEHVFDFVTLPVQGLGVTARRGRDAQGRLRDGPIVGVIDAALEAGVAPLQALRRWCGVDLDELAERSGIEIAVIAAHEDGHRDMNLRELAAVANALGVPVYLLLN